MSTECEAYIVDITNEKEVAALIKQVAEGFGQIDILVNSAGITGKTNIKSHEVSYNLIKYDLGSTYYRTAINAG